MGYRVYVMRRFAGDVRTRRGYGGDKRAHNGDKQDRQIANHLRCFLLLEVLNFWLEFALSMVLTHRY